MNPLVAVERSALALAVVSALLGLITSAGFHLLSPGSPRGAWVAHGGLFVLSLAAGGAAALRHRQIETQRWSAAHDPHATRGEREYAHREAESQRRFSATVLLLAPVALAYWLAYVFETPKALTASDFLLVTPVVGFFLGLFLGGRRWPAHSGYSGG